MADEKIKVLALVEAGYRDADIVEQLKIRASTVKRYKEEWVEKQNSQHIADLASKNPIAMLASTSLLSDSIGILDLANEDKEKLMAQVDELTEGLKGLSILNTTLQVAAIKMAQTIIDTVNVRTTAQEVFQLSGALARLHDTFFNPNNTNVNILNNDGGETNINGTPFSRYLKD